MAELVNSTTGEALATKVPIRIKSWSADGKLTVVIGSQFELLLSSSQAKWLMNYFKSIRVLPRQTKGST